LPIGHGQTISQPCLVALMIEAAELTPCDSVPALDTPPAVMAQIADRVYGIERHPLLAEVARERFRKLGYGNVDVRAGDGTRGWPEAAPFDAIVVCAAILKAQIAIGGRLVVPVGPEGAAPGSAQDYSEERHGIRRGEPRWGRFRALDWGRRLGGER
jgi:protein-L-isoaspartate(D-aspartate) O-methyltransferase